MSRINENKQPHGFNSAKRKAESYIGDKQKAKSLVKDALNKADKHKKALQKIWEELQALIRLIKAWINGNYKAPWKTILFSIAAIIYFVNPIDFIPDFIPFFGFLDDATIVAFVINSIRTDIKNFLIWEENENSFYEVEPIEEEDTSTEKKNIIYENNKN